MNEWSIQTGTDRATIILNGKVLTDDKEIIDFIDIYMKPVEFENLPDEETGWEPMRAMNIFMFLFNQEERVKAMVELLGSAREHSGLTYFDVIYRLVKERYPELGWTEFTFSKHP